MAEGPNKDPDKKKPWEENVVEVQQFFYEAFGDRDWDHYSENEMELLERNVGHAVFGPPEELPEEKNGSTGYEEKKLEQIRKICATIKKHGKFSSMLHKSGGVLVSTIYVCLNIGEGQLFPIFRIPNCDPEDELKVCPDQFVDMYCRVYRDWDDFLNNNQLPKCTCCYPRGGIYDGDDNDRVCLEFGKTPAAKAGSVVCSALDTASTVVMVGGLGVAAAALVTTVAAPVAAASAVGAAVTGVYGAGRSIAALVDRGQHQQSINVTDKEARNCWLSLGGNVLGVASGQATRLLAKAAQSGQTVGKAGCYFVNILNFGSLTVNGLGLVNNFHSLYEKYRSKEKITTLEVFQFASSCLFFTLSAFNMKTANSIIKETQNAVISDFEASLRSNRHRRMFRRVARQTRGDDGNTMQGNAKVIRSIVHIDNKDDFFAGLVRVQKQVGKSEATVTLTEKGLVEINGHLEVHPMEFSGIDKVQRQVILDATKNIKTGTWSQEQFNREMQNFCQEHNITFSSQRAETVASIRAMGSDRDSVLCKMTEQQIDVLTFSLRKLAKEHHQTILSIATELCEVLGFKKTAEFLRVVQFLANYVEQVAAEMEKRYEKDLLAAQNSQGQNFNREQFDHEYHVQGKDKKNFVRSVVENYNTLEIIPYLKAAYQRMYPPEECPSDIEDNAEDGSEATDHNSHTSPHTESDYSSDKMADASSDTNVCSSDETTGADQEADVLYKKHRDFSKFGALSDDEIYMIVQEVTGLHLYEGNSGLHRLGEAAYVSVTDPHIIPLTVIISSNRHNNTVTAGLIM